MTRFPATNEVGLPRLVRALAGALVALALCLGGAGAAQAAAAAGKDSALSKEDLACLECHGKAGLEKTLASGEKLPLSLGARGFAQSVHASSGCEGCHSDVAAGHDKQPKSVASRRAFALEQMDTCRDCHKKAVKQYEDSVHAALVQGGSARAPLCSDCHNPHATRSAKDKAGGAGAGEAVVCQKCHAGLASALADSVHGNSGDEALECKDCHQTHSVKAASLGEHMKGQCLSCHRETLASHATWLPNTERHLQAVSCPACHSPGTSRRVNLRLYEGSAAAARQAAEKVGVPQFVKLANWADTSASGLDARALWSLLQELSKSGAEGKSVLRGRLEVQTGVQAHQLGPKTLAVKDCDTCHREGAASFQAVTVSMAGPDGRPLRHEASKGVLTSLESIGSVGGFYAIGSTRIKLLDTLLLMALGAGLLIPGAHLTVKLLTRKRRAGHAAAGDTGAAEPAALDSSEPRR